MPIRTFSPITDRTETSMSSPPLMPWLDLRVRTSISVPFLFANTATGARPPKDADQASIVPPSVESDADRLFESDAHLPFRQRPENRKAIGLAGRSSRCGSAVALR